MKLPLPNSPFSGGCCYPKRVWAKSKAGWLLDFGVGGKIRLYVVQRLLRSGRVGSGPEVGFDVGL
jgi:hypothetical protein